MRLTALGLAALLGVAGCGGGSGDLHPVSGTVTVDGKPADGVQVSFWPPSGGDEESRDRYGSGVTNPQGRFELRSISDKGLAAGDYKVTFSRPLTGGKASAGGEKKTPQTRESLPDKYVDREKTDVTAQVTRDRHEFTFDLVSQPK